MHKSILLKLAARLRRHVPILSALPESVWKRAGALNTWGTNAIEGNTLTHDQVQQLLTEGSIATGLVMADAIETLQHEAAFRSLLERRRKPVDMVAALELHEQVFHGVPRTRPGQWRISNVYIAGTSFRPPRREQVIRLMNEWQQEVARRNRAASRDPFPHAAWMHHRFEQIHPFEDGNGRAGRLLLNLFLVKHGWPPVHILPPDRTRYLAALETANGGDLMPLEAFLRVAMARGLLDLLDQVGTEKDALVELPVLTKHLKVRHKVDYLALRCRQGAIPALRAGESSGPIPGRRGRPRWLTSEVGLKLGLAATARKQA